MLVSFNWLKQYLNLPDSITVEMVAEKLKNSTVEVENIRKNGENLTNVVVGKVITVEQHPNADKLKLCQVDVGAEKLSIVCGGSNVVSGMSVALAKIGAYVRWHGEGELIALKPVVIRGVESFGMICAATEIGLDAMFPPEDEKAILDLTDFGFVPGTPLSVALCLNDSVLEIDNKSLSNRPDLWGHYGIAREVAVLFNKDLAEYKTTEIKAGKNIKIKIKIQNKDLCQRYMTVALSGIKVGPSPDWLKNKLISVGLNPINNIVDITNYVMLDIGAPMHVFDANRLSGNKNDKEIMVRVAVEGEKIRALDDQEYELTTNDLVIADTEKVLAIAGVIGGKISAISDNTNTIIFEAANFFAVNIRKTSTRLNIRTDSAQRFEKSLDPNLCDLALKKAVQLVLELCPEAVVASTVVDESNFVLPVGPITINKDLFAQKIGIDILERDIVKILDHLGFELKDKKDAWAVKIPTWRATKDISLPEDLVEEVLRVYGYEKVCGILPSFPIKPPISSGTMALERQLADLAVRDFAYTETYNYSFVSGDQVNKLTEQVDTYLMLDNPLAKDRPYLRRNLIPGLLTNIANNISQSQELRFFEIGKTFCGNQSGQRATANGDELLPRQDVLFTAVFVNKKYQEPFWEIKRMWEGVARKLNIDWGIDFSEPYVTYAHVTRSLLIKSGDRPIAIASEIKPEIARRFGVDFRVGFLEINLNDLQEFGQFNPINYQRLLNYPTVERDVAFLVDKKISHRELATALLPADPLLVKIELFDVYVGEHVNPNKKSMAYRLTYAHPEHTLASAEIETAHQHVLDILNQQFKAEIRK